MVLCGSSNINNSFRIIINENEIEYELQHQSLQILVSEDILSAIIRALNKNNNYSILHIRDLSARLGRVRIVDKLKETMFY